MVRLGAFIVALIVLQGCAARARTVQPGGWLDGYVKTMRELGVRARATNSFGASLENSDRTLSAALLELRVHRGAPEHRRVAERYQELGILDAAYDHFFRVRQLDPTDARAYEALARIWRNWGFPHLGLNDAFQAVRYAPAWPVAQNTLGTVLAAMGRSVEARRAYERALSLDPRAAPSLNNLCYLSFREGKIAQAIGECRAALDVDPALSAARNNLALAYAAGRQTDLAVREFKAAGDSATASYNIGLVFLAEGQFVSASEAFDAASRERPGWSTARARAQKARALAAEAAAQVP